MMRALLLLLAIFLSPPLLAQDTMVVKNGKRIPGRVVSVDLSLIHFRTGPNRLAWQKHRDSVDRQVRTRVIHHIRYGNGVYWQNPVYGNAYNWRHNFRRRIIPRSDRNVFTLNAPNYTYVGAFPGVSIGFEYERFFRKDARLSAAFGLHWYWAGTPAFGKLYHETRANLKGGIFIPAMLYHPLGNSRVIDLGVGIAMPLGTVARYDISSYSSGSSQFGYTDYGFHPFIAFLLRADLSIHSRDHFVFALHGSCGPMIPAGVTEGLTGQFGFKIGRRY